MPIHENLRAALRSLSRRARAGLITVGLAEAAWGVPKRVVAMRLGRLARAGWVTRVRRGTYYISSLVEGPDVVVEDDWILADVLFAPCYIGGWTAAHHWGLTEQIFQETFVATAASIRTRKVAFLGGKFHLVRAKRNRVESVVPVWRGSTKVRVSSPERTLVDAFMDPAWVGGARHLLELVAAYRDSARGTEEKLSDALHRFGNGAAYKRAGFMAERAWSEAKRLQDVALAGRSTGVIRLDPGIRSRGRMNRRWGLWVNVHEGGKGGAA